VATRLIIDTDTAVDDTQAILMAVLSDAVDVEALTVVAGNVAFDREIKNAKYTLDLAGVADEIPVHEGARAPLLKESGHADHVHGDGGLGGEFYPDTGIPSSDRHAVDAIVGTARESPGNTTLACIGPLTNVALALRREPDLNDLLDEVVVMGGAANTSGNHTPAAEFNFWADPDAAKIAIRELDVTLVDWGVVWRHAVFDGDELDRLGDADTPYATFFDTITRHAREFSEERRGVDAVALPDPLAVACLLYPDLVTDAGTYFVDVDERAGMTRGYSLVDELGVTGGDPRTRVVESVDEPTFKGVVSDMLLYGDPDRSV